jgi:hypothetical protein
VPAGLDEQGHRGVRTAAPIGHQYSPWLEGRMPRLPLSQVMGQQGCDDERQEPPVPAWHSPNRCATGKPPPGRGSVD